MTLQLLQQIGEPNHRYSASLVVDSTGTVYTLWQDNWEHRQLLQHEVLRGNYATDASRIVRERERELDDILQGRKTPPRMYAAEYEVTSRGRV